MLELHKIKIIPCLFLVDRFDGTLVAYYRHQPAPVVDYILSGTQRKSVKAKHVVQQLTEEFEQDYPNHSYIVKVYTSKGNEVGRSEYERWEQAGWNLYLNCEGTQNEV